jgi:hypothetical protein
VKVFSTTIAIGAPAETVWALLTDADRYPSWNSTVEKIDGRIAAKRKIKLYTKAMPGRAFKLRVALFERPARMLWTGGMPFGLFTGTRTFTLAPAADGGIVFTMREAFLGLLAGLISRSIPDLQPSFDAFAADLKQAAERASGAVQPS